MKIAVRGGHNPQATGASGLIVELDEDRLFKDSLIKYLKQGGADVLDVTPGCCNTNDDLAYGVNKANQWGAELYIPCHFNNAYSYYSGAIGTEVWTYRENDIAERIVNSIASFGFRNRGQKISKGLYDLRCSNMTAIIIELCFVEATEDVNLYKQVGYDEIAKKVAEAVLQVELTEKIVVPDDFNSTFYLWKYPDVADAIANNQIESAEYHYYYWGKNESRQYKPSLPQDFSEGVYLEFNKDVAAAIPKSFSSAAEHYLNFGYRENRIYKEPEEAYLITKKLSYSECKELEEKLGDIVDRIEI